MLSGMTFLSMMGIRVSLLALGIIDATIIQSSTRPLSKARREELKQTPSSQIDTDATRLRNTLRFDFNCMLYNILRARDLSITHLADGFIE